MLVDGRRRRRGAQVVAVVAGGFQNGWYPRPAMGPAPLQHAAQGSQNGRYPGATTGHGELSLHYLRQAERQTVGEAWRHDLKAEGDAGPVPTKRNGDGRVAGEVEFRGVQRDRCIADHRAGAGWQRPVRRPALRLTVGTTSTESAPSSSSKRAVT